MHTRLVCLSDSMVTTVLKAGQEKTQLSSVLVLRGGGGGVLIQECNISRTERRHIVYQGKPFFLTVEHLHDVALFIVPDLTPYIKHRILIRHPFSYIPHTKNCPPAVLSPTAPPPHSRMSDFTQLSPLIPPQS